MGRLETTEKGPICHPGRNEGTILSVVVTRFFDFVLEQQMLKLEPFSGPELSPCVFFNRSARRRQNLHALHFQFFVG